MKTRLLLATLIACAVVLAAPLVMRAIDDRAYAKFWRDREAARRMP